MNRLKRVFDVIECYINNPDECANAIVAQIRAGQKDTLQMNLPMDESSPDKFITAAELKIKDLEEWKDRCMAGPSRERIDIQITCWESALSLYREMT